MPKLIASLLFVFNLPAIAESESKKSLITAAPVLHTTGVADRLYRVDCGRSVTHDMSIWTPGQNIGKTAEFSSSCWLVKHAEDWLLWDAGVPDASANDPKGWTISRFNTYYLDKTLAAQLDEINLTPNDITYLGLSHIHGDHIGNVKLFPGAKVLMQRAEYEWMNSGDGANTDTDQMKALARELIGTPKHLMLVEGDMDIFGDGSVRLISTPGHTPGHQTLLVNLKNTGSIILAGDVAHLARNFSDNVVPTLNTDKKDSIESMRRIRTLLSEQKATLFLGHDKTQMSTLKLLPDAYD
ncbi:N-acyl homoserine lactonase family protein [Pseudomonas sp. B28(2017)]|uniref:N-acyl homoserine lactonase family protein n=1 Tax=Pseudomonas sp. B28(2017) TaxID=1981730 RepID=UPI000A1EF4BF|nr:N-acyl homoserine lactonase family protein [Pseudomonas sp. B28(2017)]